MPNVLVKSVIPHPIAPLVQYPAGSTFANRIIQQALHKKATAIYVADRFLGEGTSAFILDGSSTFYVGLECFLQAKNVHIFTNHLAIAHEFASWPEPDGGRMRVELSSGEVNRDLMMVGGVSAEEYAKNVSAKVDFVVVSARELFAVNGPTGYEDVSLRIKKEAMGAANPTIIVVADYEKLSHQFSNKLPCVYPTPDHWIDLIHKKQNLYIVSTCRPDVDYATETSRIPRSPKTPKEHYLYNRGTLELDMGERFIEVRVPTAVAPAVAY